MGSINADVNEQALILRFTLYSSWQMIWLLQGKPLPFRVVPGEKR